MRLSALSLRGPLLGVDPAKSEVQGRAVATATGAQGSRRSVSTPEPPHGVLAGLLSAMAAQNLAKLANPMVWESRPQSPRRPCDRRELTPVPLAAHHARGLRHRVDAVSHPSHPGEFVGVHRSLVKGREGLLRLFRAVRAGQAEVYC